MRKIITLVALAGALIVPASANASFTSEMKAAGKVERKVSNRHPGFDVIAFCDQYKSSRYWCDFTGFKGGTMLTGKARVVYGSVRIVAEDTF